jgi:DNA-binding NtrC family response regulator
MKILVVDDNSDSLRSLEVVLSDLGHEPVACPDAARAIELARDSFFPLVITDVKMPGMDGLELLARLKELKPAKHGDVVIITGHGDMNTAIEALRKGAYDFLNKPINARELAAVVQRSAEHQALINENQTLTYRLKEKVDEAVGDLRSDLNRYRSMLRKVGGVGEVVAVSETMKRLIEETRIYHRNPEVPVLIEGETGSGKEIIARLIHNGEGFNDAPFVPLNCPAIPENLFESELFGYEAGAFTGGAAKGSRGKLELAESGSLFLDEISEMPLAMQPKLLRILEDRRFYRVGGLKQRHFRARVICAGNRDIQELVDKGRFRSDLFHRLKVGYLRVPPLRERPEEIEPLALVFLKRESRAKKKSFRKISPSAARLLESRSWPGNVRELENTIQRAVLMADAETLKAEHLRFLHGEGAGKRSTAGAHAKHANFPLPEDGLDIDSLNRAIIDKALAKFGGNKSKTARYLGMSRFRLYRRIRNTD